MQLSQNELVIFALKWNFFFRGVQFLKSNIVGELKCHSYNSKWKTIVKETQLDTCRIHFLFKHEVQHNFYKTLFRYRLYFQLSKFVFWFDLIVIILFTIISFTINSNGPSSFYPKTHWNCTQTCYEKFTQTTSYYIFYT